MAITTGTSGSRCAKTLDEAGADVRVVFNDGTQFSTRFADFTVAVRWFHRPIFLGVTLKVVDAGTPSLFKIERPMSSDITALLARRSSR